MTVGLLCSVQVSVIICLFTKIIDCVCQLSESLQAVFE